MSGRERFAVFAFLLVIMLLLPIALKAATEDEIIQEHLAQLEKKRPRMLFSPFFSFKMGSTNPDRYEYFVNQMNSTVSQVGGGSPLLSFSGIKAFDAGFSILHSGGLLSFGFSWWNKVGSAEQGDFVVSQEFGAGATTLEDFEFTSQIRVYGVYLDYQYFLLNPPQPYIPQKGLSLRAGAGIGYYGARWYLWDGFGGYRQDNGEYYELEAHLSGSWAGYHIGMGIEYPLWKGFIVTTDAQYQWMTFGRLSRSIDATMDLYLVDEDGGPIKIDMTGPRVNFGLKMYFTI